MLAAPARAQSPLTVERIEAFIETRIAAATLQERMQANAHAYDNLPRAFHKKRQALLVERGWKPEHFDATQERINAAVSALMTVQQSLLRRPADATRRTKVRR